MTMRLDQVVDESIKPHFVSKLKLLFFILFHTYFKLQILI